MPNYFVYRSGQVVIGAVARVLWGVRAEGWERIPRKGPLIVASTHESFLDPLVVGAFVPRHVWHMARHSLFHTGEKRSRFRTWLASIFGVIEIVREGTGLGALRSAEEKLAQDGAVLMFPEGTRSLDGAVRDFRAGVGLLAIRSGAQVVPVSVDGTRRLWPKGRSLPAFWRRGGVRLVYGEPVIYEDSWEPGDVAADIRRRVLEIRERGAS